MLEKYNTITMKNTASMKPKNLSISYDDNSFIYAVLGKNLINFVNN